MKKIFFTSLLLVVINLLFLFLFYFFTIRYFFIDVALLPISIILFTLTIVYFSVSLIDGFKLTKKEINYLYILTSGILLGLFTIVFFEAALPYIGCRLKPYTDMAWQSGNCWTIRENAKALAIFPGVAFIVLYPTLTSFIISRKLLIKSTWKIKFKYIFIALLIPTILMLPRILPFILGKSSPPPDVIHDRPINNPQNIPHYVLPTPDYGMKTGEISPLPGQIKYIELE